MATLALVLCALGGASAQAYYATDRWQVTASNPAMTGMGSPMTVTWSFAPDGTNISDGSNIPGTTSSLRAYLDGSFGAGDAGPDLTTRPWFPIFNQAFGRLNQLSGINFVYEPHDDGTPFSQGAIGVLGVRGDVRLSGMSYVGTSNPHALATNFYPDYAEMMIATNQHSYLGVPAGNYRRFRNVLMHEAMHGLGVDHVNSDQPLLLAPALVSTFDGPQLDDILALQRLYGDALEKNGGNDVPAMATSLGALTVGQPLVRGTLGDTVAVSGGQTDFLSIDDITDTDFFSFTLSAPQAVTLELSPKGTTYQAGPVTTPASPLAAYNTRTLSDLTLALYDSNGTTQLGATANLAGPGGNETILRELNAGTYYARVAGSQNNVQLYQLSVSAAALPADQLTWTSAGGATWTVGATASFHNGLAADVFRQGDHVTFGAGAASNAVVVAAPVAPASMTVNAGVYQFTGGSGIAVNTLVVEGNAAATLANSGNALHGIDVRSGSLAISGATNAPISGVARVAAAAALSLSGNQSFGPSSTLTGGGAVAGAVATAGVIAPGDSIGSLTLTGDLSLSSTSTLVIELGGLAAGSQHDLLSVGGMAWLDGGLVVSLASGYQPAAGAAFTILTAGDLLGGFDSQSLPYLGPSLAWSTSYAGDAVTLSISAAVLHDPADFNHDGEVDGDDLAAWRAGYGTPSGATHSQGDANADGRVDASDFVVWQRRLSAPPPLSPSAHEAPEPSSGMIAVASLVCAALGLRRRRVRLPAGD
ncbi:MAG TPA: pre-peptidase C-terminal domain-containing protein [Lacipirellulaceae bacterium]|nr:pre-peptidase C-terminal domain-containing protein [Lacipirellulaceae bacterium]